MADAGAAQQPSDPSPTGCEQDEQARPDHHADDAAGNLRQMLAELAARQVELIEQLMWVSPVESLKPDAISGCQVRGWAARCQLLVLMNDNDTGGMLRGRCGRQRSGARHGRRLLVPAQNGLTVRMACMLQHRVCTFRRGVGRGLCVFGGWGVGGRARGQLDPPTQAGTGAGQTAWRSYTVQRPIPACTRTHIQRAGAGVASHQCVYMHRRFGMHGLGHVHKAPRATGCNPLAGVKQMVLHAPITSAATTMSVWLLAHDRARQSAVAANARWQGGGGAEGAAWLQNRMPSAANGPAHYM